MEQIVYLPAHDGRKGRERRSNYVLRDLIDITMFYAALDVEIALPRARRIANRREVDDFQRERFETLTQAIAAHKKVPESRMEKSLREHVQAACPIPGLYVNNEIRKEKFVLIALAEWYDGSGAEDPWGEVGDALGQPGTQGLVDFYRDIEDRLACKSVLGPVREVVKGFILGKSNADKKVAFLTNDNSNSRVKI